MADKRGWQVSLVILALLVSLSTVGLATAWWQGPVRISQFFPTPATTDTATPIPVASPSPQPQPLPSPRITTTPTLSRPTPTSTRVVKLEIDPATTAQAGQRATAQAQESARALAQFQTLLAARPIDHTRDSRLVLAQYFAWYDGNGWNDCNISAGDRPLEPYNSDDPAAIARHVQMAGDIGLDGFLLHWFAPGDRTDRNFETLLAQSQGRSFASTIVFSRHIWNGGGATRQSIVEALRYLMERYSSHPNFLKVEGKPVLFFIDLYRTPAGPSPQQFWADVRDEIDPQRQAWWIAEGLDPSYLAVFDGLFVFKITHADYPNDYLKDSRWAGRVRQWAKQTGQPKFWLATISPGWDDLRAGCRPDVRVPNTLHRRDREDGALYQATFDAAMQSNPDWLLLSSFNEWVEGSYIEPSVQYGDKYMQMTQEFVRVFKK